MIKVVSLYSFLKMHLGIKNLTAFFFVLFVLVKPVVTLASTFSEEKYEFIDSFENNSTEEKEDVIELDVEIIHETMSSMTNVFSRLLLTITTTQENSLSGCFEIQIPPPKL